MDLGFVAVVGCAEGTHRGWKDRQTKKIRRPGGMVLPLDRTISGICSGVVEEQRSFFVGGV
jgi:hypothetical protein